MPMAVTQKSSLSLGAMRSRMAAAASDEARLRMCRALAEEARTQVAQGFRKQRDPYGTRWKPIARKGMILQLTGRLRASVSTMATPAGFRLDMPVTYAAHHQYGAPRGKLPQRQMVPMPETGGLGPIWTTAFNATATNVMRKLTRGLS